MLPAHSLAIMHSRAPDASGLELIGKVAMHHRRHFYDRASNGAGEGRMQVRRFAGVFGVDADDLEKLVYRIASIFEAGSVLGGKDVDGEFRAKHFAHDLQAV